MMERLQNLKKEKDEKDFNHEQFQILLVDLFGLQNTSIYAKICVIWYI